LNWAYDRVERRDVSADEAVASKQRYRCPNRICQGRVFLSRGDYRRAHFKHYPGEGKPSCEDYHPGLYIPQSAPNFHEDERIQADRVGFELDIVGKRRLDWNLKLRIPRSDTEHGSIVMRLGPGPDGLRELQLRAIRNAAGAFDVIPCDEPIGIVQCTPGVPASYREKLNPGSITLPQSTCKAFHATGISRLRAVGSKLYWGVSYYFIWKTSAPVSLPAFLNPEEINQNHGWRCARITLPNTVDDALAEQVRDLTRLETTRSKAILSIVVPTGSKEID